MVMCTALLSPGLLRVESACCLRLWRTYMPVAMPASRTATPAPAAAAINAVGLLLSGSRSPVMTVLLLAGGGGRLPFKGPGDSCLLIVCNQAAVQRSQCQAGQGQAGHQWLVWMYM